MHLMMMHRMMRMRQKDILLDVARRDRTIRLPEVMYERGYAPTKSRMLDALFLRDMKACHCIIHHESLPLHEETRRMTLLFIGAPCRSREDCFPPRS